MNLLFLILIIYSLTGCVSKTYHKQKIQDLKSEYEKASAKYNDQISMLEEDIKERDVVIKDCRDWKGQPSKPVKGNEPWMK